MDDFTELCEHLIACHEGERLKPYLDTNGFATIGIGHNYNANPLPSDIAEYLKDTGCITQEMENRLFQTDFNIALEDCRKLYPEFDSFPKLIREALLDIMFNMGCSKLKNKFANTVAHINAQEWDQVEHHLQDSLWYKQVGNRAKEDIALIDEGTKEN